MNRLSGGDNLTALRRKQKQRRTRRFAAYLAVTAVIAAIVAYGYIQLQSSQPKPIILYIDQGNGAVNGSNFGQMLGFASSQGFNTIFFQVYRQGVLLFTGSELQSFVSQTHAEHMKIYFALYITNATQTIPGTVIGLGEDGISLDMSTIAIAAQQSLLQELKGACSCETAVTTTDMTSSLTPNLLVLETYGTAYQQYVRPGIIASVGVFATTSKADYQSQFQYALKNSDGVMVFDYAGLLKAGY